VTRASDTDWGAGILARSRALVSTGDASEPLYREAIEMFADMGMDAFSERTRRELAATGEKIRAQAVDRPHDLTSQETQIARLAREGLTNQEIGFQLYLSARTVEWHLRKVFTKLGISSRRQLHTAVL
jgi:DNA-binding NarL/FixJ family response regulator